MTGIAETNVPYREEFSADEIRLNMYHQFVMSVLCEAVFLWFIAACVATIWGDGTILGIPARMSASQAPSLLVLLSVFFGYMLPVVWSFKPRPAPVGNVLVSDEAGLALEYNGRIVHLAPWSDLAACTPTRSGLLLTFGHDAPINLAQYPVSSEALERMASFSGNESPLAKCVLDLKTARRDKARRKRLMTPVIVLGALIAVLLLKKASEMPSVSSQMLMTGVISFICLGAVLLLERYAVRPVRKLVDTQYTR